MKPKDVTTSGTVFFLSLSLLLLILLLLLLLLLILRKFGILKFCFCVELDREAAVEKGLKR